MGNKISSIIMALIYIALGLLFIVMPKGVEDALCYVLAVAVAVFGLLYILGYFVNSTSPDGDTGHNGFAIGILMIMLAIFIVVKQDLIITLVPFLFGVMVLIRGLFTIQTAFRIRRLGFPIGFPLIMGLVIMAFGLFIMLFPLETGEALFILIGAGLLAAGVSGLVEEIFVRTSKSRHAHEKERLRDMGPAVRTYDADEMEEVEVIEEPEPAKATDQPEASEATDQPGGEKPEASEATDTPDGEKPEASEATDTPDASEAPGDETDSLG